MSALRSPPITAWCRSSTTISAACCRTLAETGLEEDTLVIYTSDHGDNLGTRTFWGKSNMYEEAVGVPLIMNGPGIPAGRRVSTPVSLVDAYPTIVEAVARGATAEERKLPGTSLLRLLNGEDADRTVFSEYHAVGSMTGIFMVRFGRYKYVHYEGYRPQLFDLEADPLETRDLALAPGNEGGYRRGREAAARDLRSGKGLRAGLQRSGAAHPGTRRRRSGPQARQLSLHAGARRGATLLLSFAPFPISGGQNTPVRNSGAAPGVDQATEVRSWPFCEVPVMPGLGQLTSDERSTRRRAHLARC